MSGSISVSGEIQTTIKAIKYRIGVFLELILDVLHEFMNNILENENLFLKKIQMIL